MRERLRTTFMGYLDVSVQGAIASVHKLQQGYGGWTAAYIQESDESIWLPSVYELLGTSVAGYNDSEQYAKNGFSPFQYQAFAPGGSGAYNTLSVKAYDGTNEHYWVRSEKPNQSGYFDALLSSGTPGHTLATRDIGIVPCFAL